MNEGEYPGLVLSDNQKPMSGSDEADGPVDPGGLATIRNYDIHLRPFISISKPFAVLIMSSTAALYLPKHHYRHPHHLLRNNTVTTFLPNIRVSIDSNHTKVRATASSESINRYSLSSVAPLEAIQFDIDGTLCDSDPLHYYTFREMLRDVGFNGGVPITEEFFIENISGMHNEELSRILLPDWEIDKSRKFFEDKEAMFRRLASEKLEAVKGLYELLEWIKDRKIRRAAVTNAPRPNAELIISSLGLDGFFEELVIGSECERAKPFPDPYLTALRLLGVSNEHAFVFEDSVSGIKAGVAAGMPVVGIGIRNPEELLADARASFVIKDYHDPRLWTAMEELDRKSR